MRIVHISDTHMWDIPLKDLPEGDILIHSGDGTFRGTIPEVSEFHKELVKHRDRYDEIYFIPGNHDFLFQDKPMLAKEIMQDIIVLDNEVDYYYNEEVNEVFKIYGSPICPIFGRWAFMLNSKDREDYWNENIPDELDIMVTHTPPKFILDKVVDSMRDINHYTGCPHLANKILEVKPKLHLFGHIHEGYGNVLTEYTNYVNSSIMNELYRPVNKPQVLEYKDGRFLKLEEE